MTADIFEESRKSNEENIINICCSAVKQTSVLLETTEINPSVFKSVSRNNGNDDANTLEETSAANDGQNMVLQLVAPHGNFINKENTASSNDILNSQNYNSQFTLANLNNNFIIRNKNIADNRFDLQLLSNKRFVNEDRTVGYDNQGFTNSDTLTDSIGVDESTIYADESSISYLEQNVKSSDLSEERKNERWKNEEKKNTFWEYLTKILSCIYCVFIVTLGVVIYISDILLGRTPIAETFSIYLVVVGFCYLVYLFVDIRLYANRIVADISRNPTTIAAADPSSLEGGDFHHISIHYPELFTPRTPAPPPLHRYCFNRGRHSGSFYLKIGAAGFCLGHLIHCGLLLGYQIIYLTSTNNDFYDCASVATLVLDILYPLYSFFQLYFIFKYSNVIINRHKGISRFAMMHCIASSLCFWIWTILRETLDSLSHHSIAKSEKQQQKFKTFTYIPESGYYSELPTVALSHTSYNETTNIDMFLNRTKRPSLHSELLPVALPHTSYSERGARDLVMFLNGTSAIKHHCMTGVDKIYENISPYLYPFTVEYSILVVGVLYILWQNIGSCETTSGVHQHHQRKECTSATLSSQTGFSSNLVIHVDCHAANKGLFAGIIVLVSSVVSIILFFIAISDDQFVKQGLLINSISELFQLVLMTIASIIGYVQITKLDINPHPISLLDDLLLFVCIPAFFLNAIFSIVPAFLENDIVNMLNIILQVTQILIQTPFIIDGLRRCSNSEQLRRTKPGRELITFLVVCNVAMWITETFEIKSADLRHHFYGRLLWTIIGHMTVPLTMFYRFHSSVCLADMWKSAYESSDDH